MALAPKFRNWLRTLGAPEDPVATDTSSEWSAMSLLKAIYGQLAGGGLQTALVNSLAGTSSSSVAIGTGSKTFTTQSGKSWQVGQWLNIASAADPTNYMNGPVTAYSSTTLTVNVDNIGGSGTLADWVISLSGTQGTTGATGATGATGPAGEVGVTGTPTTGNLAKFASATEIEDAAVAVSTDGTFAANSDAKLPTEKAVKTYADGLISALRNGVSAAFDTLAEIATELALKATINSPTFTGTPAAPTAAVGTDTTQIATTAFVNAEITNDAIKQGKHTIGVASGAIFPATTNGCAALAQAETTTNKINYKYLAFDAAAVEYAWVWFPTPKSYNASTFTMRFMWTHPSTATNFGVVWQAEMLALANDDAIDTAVGTAVTVTDTGGTTQDFYMSDETGAITPSNTAAKQDWIACRVSRLATNGSDTMTVDAHLISVEIYYTTNAATDA